MFTLLCIICLYKTHCEIYHCNWKLRGIITTWLCKASREVYIWNHMNEVVPFGRNGLNNVWNGTTPGPGQQQMSTRTTFQIPLSHCVKNNIYIHVYCIDLYLEALFGMFALLQVAIINITTFLQKGTLFKTDNIR